MNKLKKKKTNIGAFLMMKGTKYKGCFGVFVLFCLLSILGPLVFIQLKKLNIHFVFANGIIHH